MTRGRSPGRFRVGCFRIPAGKEVHKRADRQCGLGGMPRRRVEIDGAAGTAADSFAAQAVGLFEVGDDALSGALGDVAGLSDVPQAQLAVSCDGQQYTGMAAEEAPACDLLIRGNLLLSGSA
ncbi:hypothetical protein [Streptomyces sp. MAI_2237]